jgi:hypothetical protein
MKAACSGEEARAEPLKVPAMRSVVGRDGGEEEGGGVRAGAGRRDEHPALVLLGLSMGPLQVLSGGTAPPHHRRRRG